MAAASSEWIKSSFSAGAVACFEMRREGDLIAVRHSRARDEVQRYTQAEFRALLAGVRNGEFDQLLD